jgi:hypothetical protein
MSSLTVWDQVLSRIEDQVGKHSFSTWFKPTVLLADGGQSLSIRVPNPLFVEWLPKHYSVVLAEALRDVGRPDGLLCLWDQACVRETARALESRTLSIK